MNAIEGDLDIIPVLLWIDDLRRLALANRPDVQAARFNVEAARVGVQLAIASKARDVTVGGQYARTGS
ncbi:TolC family protein, partial [Acinetobacter baumannii]